MKKFKRITVLLMMLLIVLTGTTFAMEKPDIVGTRSMAVDMSTKDIIYAENIDEEIQIASLTKLMTALLLAENMDKNDELVYTEAAYAQPPYAYRTEIHPVEIGDKIRAEDAMDILLIYSANDIAYMIGDNVAGNTEAFIDMMHQKAKDLGMKHTTFTTLNGLDDGEEKPYSTTYDVALLSQAAFENPWIKESMAKATASVQFINKARGIVETRNKLLGINGNIAGKTGYTSLAGRCFVALYQRDGREIMGIVMNSEYNFPIDTQVFEDMEKLIDYSYKAEKSILHAKGKQFETLILDYAPIPFIKILQRQIHVPLVIQKDIAYYDVNLPLKEEIVLNNQEDIQVWNIDKETVLGKIIIYQGPSKREYDLTTTLTKRDLIFKNLPIYMISFIILIFLIVLLTHILKRIPRRRKNYRRFY